MELRIKKELGDYQTPFEFSKICTKWIQQQISFEPQQIIEPTCGQGHFLMSCNEVFPQANLLGVEIQNDYLETARKSLLELGVAVERLQLVNSSIFDFDFDYLQSQDVNVLAIGNPPWATNSELSQGQISNLPQKSNHRKLKGLEALTGASNFDICENIILDCLQKIKSKSLAVAMLCKTTVALNVIQELHKQNYPVSRIKLVKYNSQEIFNVSVPACLLYIESQGQNDSLAWSNIEVYRYQEGEFLQDNPLSIVNGSLILNSDLYVEQFDGLCQLEWRQGVKHDASKVMELTCGEQGSYFNGLGEIVNIEEEHIFPLLKSSDVGKYNLDLPQFLKLVATVTELEAETIPVVQQIASTNLASLATTYTDLNIDYFDCYLKTSKLSVFNQASGTRKFVIVTQPKIGVDTAQLANSSPLTWAYLESHSEILDHRKSNIYRNARRFAMFGIGEYSFAPYKVVVSGFYKEPQFKLVAGMRPVMLDDTCYFLSFVNLYEAMFTCLLLNSELVRNFLLAITNLESKRPFTKKILQRVDLYQVAKQLGWQRVQELELETWNTQVLTQDDWHNYLKSLQNKESR